MGVKFLLPVAVLSSALAAYAYTVDQSRWFAYFQGNHPQHPSLLLLSRAKCAAKGARAADKWHTALEIVRMRLIDNTVEEIEVPACWRRDPEGSANRQYCRVDRQANELGDVCLWIGDKHFTDTGLLPQQAPR